jgi:cytochrome P450
MEQTTARTEPLSDDWCRNHFDHLSPDLAATLPQTMARMRQLGPVTHSQEHGGFWTVSTYGTAVDTARNWEDFTSTQGLAILSASTVVRNLPVEADPPEQRIFKNLTNPYFTPSATLPWEGATRAIVTRLIDGFIERGSCDFMDEFARHLPSQAFFELALNAPVEDVEEVSLLASVASVPNHPTGRESWLGLYQWIKGFIETRRNQEPVGDVVDGVINARVGDRPISDEEIIGTIQLLILGGLETTAAALGLAVLRFCREPAIPALLRREPGLIPRAIQELLRLEPPFVSIGRTATRDLDLEGNAVKKGDKVLIHWASANRDGEEFEDPDEFRLDREHNRHVSFGMGVHRCTGSNLARFNMRIALEEVLRRMQDIAVPEGPEITFHAGMTRGPLTLPITFTPGPREGDER